MNVYWFVAIITLLINRLLPSNTEKEYLRNLILSFIPLFIYGAIRVDYGNDYPVYELYFDIFHSSGDFIPDYEAHSEIGYQYLCYIMPSFRSLLVLNSFILALSFIVFMYNNIPSNYAWLVIVLLFLMPEKNIFGSLVGMRNGFVVTTFLLTFSFVQQRRYYIVLPIAVVLSTIHTSALAYIPLAYLLARDIPLSKKEFYLWIIGAVVLMVFSTSTLVNFMMPVISSMSDNYERQLMDLNDASRGILNYSANIILMISFLYYAYYRREKLSSQQNSLIRMAAFYCVSGCLGPLSGRMTYYFAMYYIGGVVMIYSDEWINKTLKVLLLVLVILIACYATFYVWMGSSWWNHSVYHSIFDVIRQ